MGGERNFRQQVKHTFAFGQCAGNEADVDFGFSRRGDAVEQADVVALPAVADVVKGAELCFGQLREFSLGGRVVGSDIGRPVVCIDEPFLRSAAMVAPFEGNSATRAARSASGPPEALSF